MGSLMIIDEITRWKHEEIARDKRAAPLEATQVEVLAAPPPRDFAAALSAPGAVGTGAVRLIAEVKQASPSRGLIRRNFDAVALAREYEANGASAVSVLTDEHYFRGSLGHLRAIGQSIDLPLLCKDFFLDPYQVYRARAAGADAVLLIVAALSDDDLLALHQLIESLGMVSLVEVHNEVELGRALRLDPHIIGINNRDLRTFEVNLETTVRLRPLVPAGVTLVSESGIRSRADVARLAAIGADAMLVGEALVGVQDVGAKVQELLG
jgi:indole-3-glycerol phosphate synthase